jgi:hypothetical protein
MGNGEAAIGYIAHVKRHYTQRLGRQKVEETRGRGSRPRPRGMQKGGEVNMNNGVVGAGGRGHGGGARGSEWTSNREWDYDYGYLMSIGGAGSQ